MISKLVKPGPKNKMLYKTKNGSVDLDVKIICSNKVATLTMRVLQ